MPKQRRPSARRVRGRKRLRHRHLFRQWKSWRRRLRRAAHLALFLDFDGTLAPIVHHPDEVQVPESTLRSLRRLARHPQVTLSVVSGRRAADVRQYVRVPRIRYMGLHGWERGGRRIVQSPPLIRRLKRRLRTRLASLEGIWVQDKTLSLVVHYRRAQQEAVRQARALARQAVEPEGSRVRVMQGKKVWEILPREVKGKGAAVRELLARLPEGTLAIYLGDDTTDESAFAALPEGLTVRVGIPRRTEARSELRNPREVGEFLHRLEDALA
jgi:trehalose 6-phosphate phosphatase